MPPNSTAGAHSASVCGRAGAFCAERTFGVCAYFRLCCCCCCCCNADECVRHRLNVHFVFRNSARDYGGPFGAECLSSNWRVCARTRRTPTTIQCSKREHMHTTLTVVHKYTHTPAETRALPRCSVILLHFNGTFVIATVLWVCRSVSYTRTQLCSSAPCQK